MVTAFFLGPSPHVIGLVSLFVGLTGCEAGAYAKYTSLLKL